MPEDRGPVDLLVDNLDMWAAYMLYDQGYVSMEKAAELSPADLRDFRQFCKEVATDLPDDCRTDGGRELCVVCAAPYDRDEHDHCPYCENTQLDRFATDGGQAVEPEPSDGAIAGGRKSKISEHENRRFSNVDVGDRVRLDYRRASDEYPDCYRGEIAAIRTDVIEGVRRAVDIDCGDRIIRATRGGEVSVDRDDGQWAHRGYFADIEVIDE